MNVHQLRTSPYDANTYLVNGKILIDTSMETNRLVQQIEEHIDIHNLELIILTHCHYDHTASASQIAITSGAPIAIHQDDAPHLNDDIMSVSSLFGHPAPDIRVDITYRDGDTIPLDNGENLEVIHTPGHTPGGICLYEPDSKSLFSGDTIFPGGSIGRTDFAGGSAGDLSRSIEKLTHLDVHTLYPGHGPVTHDNINRQIRMSLKMAISL